MRVGRFNQRGDGGADIAADLAPDAGMFQDVTGKRGGRSFAVRASNAKHGAF